MVGDDQVRGANTLKRAYFALILSLTVLQFVAVLCALSQPSYGYADPGSGLLAIQMISITFAGAIFIVRRQIRTILGKMPLIARRSAPELAPDKAR
jgi:hypothetical protein